MQVQATHRVGLAMGAELGGELFLDNGQIVPLLHGQPATGGPFSLTDAQLEEFRYRQARQVRKSWGPVVKYSPDQPRDERGRFSSGFGQLAVKHTVEDWDANTLAEIAYGVEPAKVNSGPTAKSNAALVALWEHQGFNQLPTKVKELDPARRIWRGEAEVDHVAAFTEGDRFGNSGMYGNGTYFGTQVTAGTYAGGQMEKVFPAQWRKGAQVKAFSSQQELFGWAKGERDANLARWRETRDPRFHDAARIADADPGTYASLVGLDGYTVSIADPWAAAEGETKIESVTVVLNRGALEVLE